MKQCSLYLDSQELDVLPSDIQISIPARKESYQLVEAGEREIMRGVDLATITIRGILFYPETHYNEELMLPSEQIEQWQNIAEKAQPIQLIYIAHAWDINTMCTLQNITWKEVGGSFDIEYELILKKWLPIETRTATNMTLPSRASTTSNANSASKQKQKSYTIKDGDTLQHIAKCLLGDASRWNEIYQLNKDTIKNPNMIYPGQVLVLPEDASGSVSKRSHATNTKKTTSSSKNTSSKNTNTKKTTASTNNATPVSTGTSSNSTTKYQTPEDIFQKYKNKK